MSRWRQTTRHSRSGFSAYIYRLATFTPYFEAKAHRDPTGSGAYIRVRVPDGPRPDGSILVYLPNGTGLVVNSNQLLHLDEVCSVVPVEP